MVGIMVAMVASPAYTIALVLIHGGCYGAGRLVYRYDRTLMQSVAQPTERAVNATTGAIAGAGTKVSNAFGYLFGGKNLPAQPPAAAAGAAEQGTPTTGKNEPPP